jgi:hypothetical protein
MHVNAMREKVQKENGVVVRLVREKQENRYKQVLRLCFGDEFLDTPGRLCDRVLTQAGVRVSERAVFGILATGYLKMQTIQLASFFILSSSIANSLGIG